MVVIGVMGLWLGCSRFAATDGAGDAGGAANADAAAAGDGAISTSDSSFCDDAGSPKRCIDFDRPSQIASPFGFDRVLGDLAGVGGLSISGAASTSSPNSLLVETTTGSSQDAQVELVVAPALVPADLHARMRFRYDQLVKGASSSTHVVTLRCRETSDAQIFLKLDGSGDLDLRQQDPNEGDAPDVLVQGQWHALDVQWRATAGLDVTVAVDGKTLYGGAVALQPLDCTNSKSPVVLQLGSAVSSGAGDYVVRFDDVVVDWP